MIVKFYKDCINYINCIYCIIRINCIHLFTLFLEKPANMSSYHGYGLVAGKCTDGIYLPSDVGLDEPQSLCNTAHEINPWLRINLESAHCVWAVRILNRAEGT